MKTQKSLFLVSLILFFFLDTCLMPAVLMAKGTNPTSPTPVTSVTLTATNVPTSQVATNAATTPSLIAHDLTEIHGSISLPKEWTLLPGKLLEGDVLLATKEKISGENDPYTTGLSMTLDRNGAKDSGQKPTEYAMSLAREAHDKAGDEASPLRESQNGPFHEIRFDFPIAGDLPLQITEVLRANEKTGTLAVILWQSPKEEALALQGLRDTVLAGLTLDPEK
jgi:hypothetical protein